ncbi:MAG: hypothetical protein JXR37_26100 [Kiritimatiellae bacterium]|nr:hypothetical protein [Kiritimatiellia bacterium]
MPAADDFGESESTGLTFRPFDLWVDAGGEQLAAYQVELAYDKAQVRIVGLEGGEGVYKNPPYFDRAGFEGGRIVVAAFTTSPDTPKGKVRVARIHLAVHGAADPKINMRLVTAAKPGGERIAPAIDLKPVRKGE